MAQLPQSDVLSGRTALIAGGTGSVGRVLVEAFLRGGARVVVPSRSESRLAALRGSLPLDPDGQLVTLVGDLSDEADSARVLEQVLERAGPLDAAVATLGGFVAAPSVLEASLADLQRALDGYLLAHFMVAKTLIPALEERGGSYTFINGPLAFESMFPGTGLVSIATAGQAMLARTIMQEEADTPVRINELVIYTRFGGGEDDGKGPVSQRDVGRYAVLLASEAGNAVSNESVRLNSLDPIRELSP